MNKCTAKKVVLVGPSAKAILNFRRDLILEIIKLGHDVSVITSSKDLDKSSEKILRGMGVDFYAFPLRRSGFNIFIDLYSIIKLYQIIAHIRPDFVLSFTIKSVIWTGLISNIYRKFKFFALITGLGYAFNAETLGKYPLKLFATMLYRVALLSAEGVIFQNKDDLSFFKKQRIARKKECFLVAGSGVNLDFFQYLPPKKTNLKFIMVARLLRSKGVIEFCSAASIMKKRYPDFTFMIVGAVDPSPDGLSLSEIESFKKAGAVEFVGEVQDVRSYIESSHIFVLPSYHEGMPRSSLEAMAIGRAILTTDIPGCRDTVIEGLNGYLIKPKSLSSLVEGMELMVASKDVLETMGLESRKIAENFFDSKHVNQDMVTIMKLNLIDNTH